MRKVFEWLIPVILSVNLTAQEQPVHLRLFTPQELKADVDSLYRIITSNHPDLWKYADKKSTDLKWEEVKASIRTPMTRWDFIRYVAPLLNQYHDGHTNLAYDFEYPEVDSVISRKGLWFPFMVAIEKDEIVITGEYGTGSSEYSAQSVLAINGKSAKEILDALIPLMAGDYKENIQASLGRLFPFFLWAAYGWDRDYSITTKNQSGRVKAFSKRGIAPPVYFNAAFPKNDWTMEVFDKESLAVVECRSYRNEKAARKFIDSAFTVIRERKIRKLAFDIRRNGGGNSSIGDYFLSYLTDSPFADIVSKTITDGELLSKFREGSWVNKMLVSFRQQGEKKGNYYTRHFNVRPPDSVNHPENKFKGEFYLLTGPATYSSAHMTALTVKCYGLGKIVGQPTGERIDLTGESIGFSLPNTRLYGYCATAVYKAACGDTRSFGVQPDVFIKPDRIGSGIDPVIAFLRKTSSVRTSESLSK